MVVCEVIEEFCVQFYELNLYTPRLHSGLSGTLYKRSIIVLRRHAIAKILDRGGSKSRECGVLINQMNYTVRQHPRSAGIAAFYRIDIHLSYATQSHARLKRT